MSSHQLEVWNLRYTVISTMQLSPIPPGLLLWLIPVLIVDVILRGFALWGAARRKQLWWFIALMVVNSLGVLPLLYLVMYACIGKKKRK